DPSSMKKISADFASRSRISLSCRYNSGRASTSLYTGMTIEISMAAINPSKTGMTRVRLFKRSQVFLHIERSFEQRFRIPFAAGSGEELATIDADGSGQSRQRVGYTMNNVAAER